MCGSQFLLLDTNEHCLPARCAGSYRLVTTLELKDQSRARLVQQVGTAKLSAWFRMYDVIMRSVVSVRMVQLKSTSDKHRTAQAWTDVCAGPCCVLKSHGTSLMCLLVRRFLQVHIAAFIPGPALHVPLVHSLQQMLHPSES